MLTAASRKAKSARRLRSARKEDANLNQDQDSITDSETEGEVSTGPRRRQLRSSVAPHKNKSISFVAFNTSSRKDARQTRSNSSRNVNDKDLSNTTKSKDLFRAFDGSALLLIGTSINGRASQY